MKIFTMKTGRSLKLADREIKVMKSWLLSIPAGLREVHPHMKYQLATISRTSDSTWDKNLKLAKVGSQWTVKVGHEVMVLV